MSRRRVRVRWPRVNVRMGPVGLSIGATTASIFTLCCTCNLWHLFF